MSHLLYLGELVMDYCTTLTALPAVVCRMSSLTVLSICSNSFQSLPAAIANLRKLRVLDVSVC
jgi:Leucine-rich repeat (LRR) protein